MLRRKFFLTTLLAPFSALIAKFKPEPTPLVSLTFPSEVGWYGYDNPIIGNEKYVKAKHFLLLRTGKNFQQ